MQKTTESIHYNVVFFIFTLVLLLLVIVSCLGHSIILKFSELLYVSSLSDKYTTKVLFGFVCLCLRLNGIVAGCHFFVFSALFYATSQSRGRFISWLMCYVLKFIRTSSLIWGILLWRGFHR
jgi:hypothetical protein